MRNTYEILVGKPKRGNLGVMRIVILNLFLKKFGGKMWSGFVWLRAGTNGGL